MRKIKRIVNKALIFTVIVVVLCSGMASAISYAEETLRLPIGGIDDTLKRIKKEMLSARGGAKDDFKQQIQRFIEEFHPVLHRAVKKGVSTRAINENGKEETVFSYPYACLVGCDAAKFVLEKIYGERLIIDVVKVKHPNMEQFQIGRHLILIITDTFTDKKYFLSFFEGIFDEGFSGERVKKVIFLISQYRLEKIGKCNTEEYIEWFKKQCFPPVFFEFEEYDDIFKKTSLTVIGKFKEEASKDEIPKLTTEQMLGFKRMKNDLEIDRWVSLFGDMSLKVPSRHLTVRSRL